MHQNIRIEEQPAPLGKTNNAMRGGQSRSSRHRAAIFMGIVLCLIFAGMPHVAPAQTGVEAAPTPGSSAILSVIRWSGSQPEAAGRSVEIRFALYQDQAGGLALWHETQSVEVGADGKYSVLLGASSAEGLPASLFQAGEARWIEARPASAANAEPTAAPPRALLAAVPYAFKAVDAETLAGRAASDYVTREDMQTAVAAGTPASAQVHPDSGPTGSGTTGFVPLWTGTSNLGNSAMAQSGTKIGIDTATPAATLDVNGTTTLRANTSMPALGTATASGGFSSPVFAMSGSSFLNGGAAVNQKFAWEVQAQGNNTASPSSVLSLLYASGTSGLTNTGFSILPSGSIFTESNVTVQSPAATPATGHFSSKVDFEANVWNSSTAQSVPLNFALSALPTGNNTPTPSANLSLEFATGSGVAPVATGLSFAPNGIINFAPSQTFPGTGPGTITGVTASSPITGGGTSGSVSIGLNTAALETTLNPIYAQLGTNALFQGYVQANTSGNAGPALTGLGFNGAAGAEVQSDSSFGIEAFSNSNDGVFGNSMTPSPGDAAVFGAIGSTSSATYSAVAGSVSQNTGFAAGTWGDNAGDGLKYSAGVVGTADDGDGGAFYNNSTSNAALLAQNLVSGNSSGSPATIRAFSFGNSALDLSAVAFGPDSFGVHSIVVGNGSVGVYGESDGVVDPGNVPTGVSGFTIASDSDGVVGQALGSGGFGVVGIANGAADTVRLGAVGVYGSAASGTGVLGISIDHSNDFNHLDSNGTAFGGVWGDSSLNFGTDPNSAFAGSITGTADNAPAGFFGNDSATFTTVFVFNNGAGGTGVAAARPARPPASLFNVFKASSAAGTCGIGDGDLACTGRVKSLVTTQSGAHTVETYSMQSPENWMEDFGSGELKRGVAVVTIDPAFADTVTADASYHVFITPNGDSSGLYVIKKTATSFEVRESKGGTSSLSFDYRIVAKRRGFEADRLTDVTERFNTEQARVNKLHEKLNGPVRVPSADVVSRAPAPHPPMPAIAPPNAAPPTPRPTPRPIAPRQARQQVHPVGITEKIGN